jgi:hypothetical protein
MDRFLIKISHHQQDCRELIQLLRTQGHLRQFDWGCLSGVHSGWAVIEADNVAEARLAVPPALRGQAHVVKVTKLDAAMFGQVHVDEFAPQSLDMIRMNAAFPCWW